MLRQEWQFALVRDIQGCFPEEVDVALRSERREVDIPSRGANCCICTAPESWLKCGVQG